MLRALFEVDITPDLILGTSVGALNGAMVARDPTPAVIGRLTDLWQDAQTMRTVSDRPLRTVRRAVSTGHPHLLLGTAAAAARRGVRRDAPSRTWPSASRSARPASSGPPSTGSTPAGWWTRSWRAPPYPGLLPPARVGDEHFLDGGIVNSIPLGRAVLLGADRVFVLQVGPHRPAAAGADPALAGRPRLLRDRPAPPLRPRARRDPRRRGGARPPRPRDVGPRRLAAGPPRLLRRWATASTPATRRRKEYLAGVG